MVGGGGVSMPRVVGIDWSLSKTGLGVITQRTDGACLASGGLVKGPTMPSKAQRAKLGLPPKPTLLERRTRIADAARDITRTAMDAKLVVIEDLVLQGPGRSADLIAGWWYIVGPLLRAEVPVAVVSVASMKLAVAGSGKADKAAVAVSAVKLWPDLTIESDDVGDAVGLAHLGAVALGWNVPTLKRHREVKWQEWPDLPDPAEAVPA